VAQIKFQRVCKVYTGNEEAVHNVNLEIQDEEFLVLVGPSGCGKSTTLRMVAGLEEITSGIIKIGDQVVNQVAPKDRDIAMVFQNYALYPHMTVRRNMAFGLKLRKIPKPEIEKRVQSAAQTLGIVELLDRKPSALSGGQRQRVALGRAIVRKPAAFLFDEPLSNLDTKLRIETRSELKRLHQQLKTTTIYVTHDQEEAMTLGHRVVVMNKGKIQQCDTPLEIFDYPVNRFVAGFVGSPSMAFLDGKLISQDGGIWFEGQGVKVRLPEKHSQYVADRIEQQQEIVLGVRPGAMYLRERTGEKDNSVPVTIDQIEPLGRSMDVYVSTSEKARFVARVRAIHDIKHGEQATIYINMSKVHIFEPGELGQTLTNPKPQPSPPTTTS